MKQISHRQKNPYPWCLGALVLAVACLGACNDEDAAPPAYSLDASGPDEDQGAGLGGMGGTGGSSGAGGLLDAEPPIEDAAAADSTVENDAEPVDGGMAGDAADIDAGIVDAEVVDAQAVDAQVVDAAVPMDAMLPPEPIEAIVPEPGEEFEILFVGNSYTSVNALDEVVCELARQTGRFEEVICQRITRDGRRLSQHANDAASGGELAQLLNPNDRRRILWDVVVLQEQSQIPGFPAAQADHASFVEAVAELNGRIAAAEAQTALLMTWGRRDGDARNLVIFPDFPTMQTRLNQGYTGAAEAASMPDRPVHVIAVGEAWRRTYLRDPDGDFRNLYLNDGSHPSRSGTLLTAMTILRRTIAVDPRTLNQPEGWALDAELVERLANDARGEAP